MEHCRHWARLLICFQRGKTLRRVNFLFAMFPPHCFFFFFFCNALLGCNAGNRKFTRGIVGKMIVLKVESAAKKRITEVIMFTKNYGRNWEVHLASQLCINATLERLVVGGVCTPIMQKEAK